MGSRRVFWELRSTDYIKRNATQRARLSRVSGSTQRGPFKGSGECSGRLIWDETRWLGLGIIPIFLLKNVLTASFLILQPWNEIVLHCVFFSSNHYFAINWRQVSALSFQCRLLVEMNHKGMIDIAVWWFRPLSGSKRTHGQFIEGGAVWETWSGSSGNQYCLYWCRIEPGCPPQLCAHSFPPFSLSLWAAVHFC